MSKFKFNVKADKFRSVKSVILEKMANNAVNFFKVDVFDAQGWIDNTVKPWAPLKKPDSSRKILVKTGRLRQSIQIIARKANSIVVGTNVPYSEYINDGTSKMPQRKFIGVSARLERINAKVLKTEMKKIL